MRPGPSGRPWIARALVAARPRGDDQRGVRRVAGARPAGVRAAHGGAARGGGRENSRGRRHRVDGASGPARARRVDRRVCRGRPRRARGVPHQPRRASDGALPGDGASGSDSACRADRTTTPTNRTARRIRAASRCRGKPYDRLVRLKTDSIGTEVRFQIASDTMLGLLATSRATASGADTSS